MHWWSRWKYRVLLVTLLLLVVVTPILRAASDTRLLSDVVFSLVFVAAIRAIFTQPRLRSVALALGIPTLVGMWTGYALPDLPPTFVRGGFHTLAALFFGFTIGVILWNVYREKGVSADGICGTFCGYVMVGLAFGHLYDLADLLQPGSLRGEDVAATPHDRRYFLLVYFSLMTLTTVGYGDITPATDTTRALAVTEAVIGQFYLAVLVAELIGKRVSATQATP
jgi:hypothetical protein